MHKLIPFWIDVFIIVLWFCPDLSPYNYKVPPKKFYSSPSLCRAIETKTSQKECNVWILQLDIVKDSGNMNVSKQGWGQIDIQKRFKIKDFKLYDCLQVYKLLQFVGHKSNNIIFKYKLHVYI